MKHYWEEVEALGVARDQVPAAVAKLRTLARSTGTCEQWATRAGISSSTVRKTLFDPVPWPIYVFRIAGWFKLDRAGMLRIMGVSNADR